MLLPVVGGMLDAGMRKRRLWLLTAGGVLYLASTYVPFVGYRPRYYGLLGTAILVLLVAFVWEWTRRPPMSSEPARTASDPRMVGPHNDTIFQVIVLDQSPRIALPGAECSVSYQAPRP